MNNSGDYGYGGFGEDQYTDYYSTYENYSSAGANQPGSYPNAQGFGGARHTGFGTPQPLFGTGSKNAESRPLLDTPTGFGTPQPLFGTETEKKPKPTESAKPQPLFGIQTGFGEKPKQIGFGKPQPLFGIETGFGSKPKQIGFGTPQPLFGTETVFGVQPKQIGFGTPQPLFGTNTGFGTGFSTTEVEQWQKYDGKKRTLTGAALGGSGSAAKKAKKAQESKIKLIYGRDASYGTVKYNPSMISLEEKEKDDINIKVDKILTNKKFNFWNLPAKAKVVLVSNIPLNVANPRFLFNLFCFYGDVYRIKILHRKKDVSLIEFSKATNAAIARDNLDGFMWCGQKLVVSFARFDCIKPPLEEVEANYYQNFEVPEYKMMHRFLNEEVARSYLLRIVKPCQYLHVANVPAGKSSSDIANLFAETGLKVLDFLGYKFIPSRKSLIEATATGRPLKVRAMVSLKLETASDAALAMAYFNGKYSSIESPEGIRVSFSSTTTESEKTKEIKGWTSVPSQEKFD